MNNYEKYNLIINKYFNQSEVKGAIMLTAPWGSGKSYYVDQYLNKYLDSEGIKMINISLYGLSTIQELNNILFNSFFAHLKIKEFIDNKAESSDNFFARSWNFLSEKINRFSSSAKPYIELVTSKGTIFLSRFIERFAINLDMSHSERDVTNITRIIENIKKCKILIVFEDIERSKINILDLLGYVNNLTDSSSMKVILVVNENVFLKKDDSSSNFFNWQNNAEKIEDDEVKDYLKNKEKTIIDTISFVPENEMVIDSIISRFDEKYKLVNNKFNQYKESIVNILKNENCYNYRVLIFALQKVIDYFGESVNSRNERFFQAVVLNILRFAIKERSRSISDDSVSNESLGIYNLKYYVKGDISVINDIDSFEERYINYINELDRNDYVKNIINVKLSCWFEYSQYEFEKTIEEIFENIKNGTINCKYYKDILYFLLTLKKYVNNTDVVDSIKKLCLKKMSDEEVDVDQLLKNQQFSYDVFVNLDDKNFEEYNDFLKKYNSIISSKQKETLNGEELYDSLDGFNRKVTEKEMGIYQTHTFLSSVDIDMLSNLISSASSKEIIGLRLVLQSFYKITNLKEIYPNECCSIKELLDSCKTIVNIEQDKIKKQTIEWLITDLTYYTSLYN